MTLFIIDPVFLSIFCQLLSGYIHNIDLSSAISHPLISYWYSFFVRVPLLWHKLNHEVTTIVSKALFKKAHYSSFIP